MNNVKYEGSLYNVRHAESLREIIESSVKLFSGKTAYLEKDRPGGTFMPITYKQVGKDVESLGTRFLDMGLKGEKIAVIGETAYLWLLTYYATVCTQNIIVPLDKNLPDDEVRNLVERSGAKALVYSGKSEKSIKALYENPFEVKYFISMALEEHEEGTLSLKKLLEEGRKLVKEGNKAYAEVSIDPDVMSTLMYTSGTTGMSKGVMLSQRNIASNVVNMSRYVQLEKNAVVLSILPVHHAYEMTCVIWTTFYQGKTIAICEGLKYIQKNMVEVKANVLVGVPLVFEKMYRGIWKQAEARGEAEKLRKAIDLSRKLKLFNKPRLVKKLFKAIHQNMGGEMNKFIVGGAAVDPKVIKDFEAMGIPMIQGYGMSENAPIIAVNQDRYSIAASVGKPLVGTDVEIRDANEEGIGEIACKGPSVMLGYYNNEEATKEVLTEDGWLLTGDLGYMDDKGFLYITGRKKTVIVTRGGKNIYPEEIETVIMENDLVQEVLVHGIADDNVDNIVLTADIYPNKNKLKAEKGDLTSGEVYYFYKELMDEINKTLPPYKIIKRINIRNEEFEKTTTGKIKRYNNLINNGKSGMDTEASHINANLPSTYEADIDEIKSYLKHYKSKDKSLGKIAKTMRPFINVPLMLKVSMENKANEAAVIQKDGSIAYKQLMADINYLGTAMCNGDYRERALSVNSPLTYEQLLLFLSGMCGACMIKLSIDGAEVMADDEVRKLISEGQRQMATGDRQFVDMQLDTSKDILFVGGEHSSEGSPKKFNSMDLAKEILDKAVHATYEDSDRVEVISGDLWFSLLLGVLVPLYFRAAISLEEVKSTVLICKPEDAKDFYKKCCTVVEENGQLGLLIRWNKMAKKVGLDTVRPIIEKLASVLGKEVNKLIILGDSLNKDEEKFFKEIAVKIIYFKEGKVVERGGADE